MRNPIFFSSLMLSGVAALQRGEGIVLGLSIDDSLQEFLNFTESSVLTPPENVSLSYPFIWLVGTWKICVTILNRLQLEFPGVQYKDGASSISKDDQIIEVPLTTSICEPLSRCCPPNCSRIPLNHRTVVSLQFFFFFFASMPQTSFSTFLQVDLP